MKTLYLLNTKKFICWILFDFYFQVEFEEKQIRLLCCSETQPVVKTDRVIDFSQVSFIFPGEFSFSWVSFLFSDDFPKGNLLLKEMTTQLNQCSLENLLQLLFGPLSFGIILLIGVTIFSSARPFTRGCLHIGCLWSDLRVVWTGCKTQRKRLSHRHGSGTWVSHNVHKCCLLKIVLS